MRFSKIIPLTFCILFVLALHCIADVKNSATPNHRQFIGQQQQKDESKQQRTKLFEITDQTAYPAVGFRPAHPLNLPTNQITSNFAQFDTHPQTFNLDNSNLNNVKYNNNKINDLSTRPENPFAAPTADFGRLRQLQAARLQEKQQPIFRTPLQPKQQQQFKEHQQFGAPFQQKPFQQQQSTHQSFSVQSQQFQQLGPQQFPLVVAKSSTLTAEPDREVLDETPEDEEVDIKNAAENIPATPSAAPAGHPQAPVTYFPANAFHFFENFPAGVPQSATSTTFVQYQPNSAAINFAKIIENQSQLPISTQYYTANTFLPSTLAYNAYTNFLTPAPELQAWQTA